MVVLLWLSVFLLLVTLGLYLIWSFRDADVSPRTIRITFFSGSALFFVLFVAFTVHTLLVIPQTTHASMLTPSVAAGKLAWQKYLCVDCHTILGNGAYYAPDLTQAWNRFVDRSGGDARTARIALVSFLQNPPQASPTRRGMPRVVSEADANSIADFLTWTSKIETNGWPPKPVKSPAAPPRPSAGNEGAKLFDSKGCTACHSIGSGPLVGPDLAGVSSRYSRAQLIGWIQHPQSPRMPALGLSDRDASLIADYLLAQKEVTR